MYKTIKSTIFLSIIFLTVILGIVFTINYQIYYIVGISMEPTIQKNSLILVRENQIAKYGDIIVIDFGEESEKEAKRVIGLPGDEITVDDYVYINGVRYMNSKCDVDTCNKDVYTLDLNEYFVIGDNYMDSLDSRSFGPIKNYQILGVHI